MVHGYQRLLIKKEKSVVKLRRSTKTVPKKKQFQIEEKLQCPLLVHQRYYTSIQENSVVGVFCLFGFR